MEHNDELDAKSQREDDADAGVGPSIDDQGTHDLDLDDYDHLDEDSADEPLKTEEEDEEAEGELISDEPDADDEEQPPFHEHPRWQQMLKERDELKEQLEGKDELLADQDKRMDQYDRYLQAVAAFQQPTQPQPDPAAESLPFDEVLAMSDTEIYDEFRNDPKGFLSAFGARTREEALQEFRKEAAYQAQEAAVAQGLESFAEDNPDFMDMVESGEIAMFIERHPIHNAISAYHSLKSLSSQDTDQTDREALEQQIREDERKKVLADIQAKQGATVLDGSSGTGPQAGASTAIEPELQDTSAHGGKRSVLTERLKRLRERF